MNEIKNHFSFTKTSNNSRIFCNSFTGTFESIFCIFIYSSLLALSYSKKLIVSGSLRKVAPVPFRSHSGETLNLTSSRSITSPDRNAVLPFINSLILACETFSSSASLLCVKFNKSNSIGKRLWIFSSIFCNFLVDIFGILKLWLYPCLVIQTRLSAYYGAFSVQSLNLGGLCLATR